MYRLRQQKHPSIIGHYNLFKKRKKKEIKKPKQTTPGKPSPILEEADFYLGREI